MCANCGIWWRAWWCSRRVGRSAQPTFRRRSARVGRDCCPSRSARSCAGMPGRRGASWNSSCAASSSSSCRWRSCVGAWMRRPSSCRRSCPLTGPRSRGSGSGGASGAPAYSGLVGGLEPIVERPTEPGVTLRPGMTMAEIERAAIEAALRDSRGNRRKAAEVLQIGERTLYRKLREYHLVPDDASDGIDDA
ncbi:MAG: hypothetical protein IPF87_02840 [Gemmatimonadetes bacterium]|nr:hypothetical protein [Gemmatimonadota bacterium]